MSKLCLNGSKMYCHYFLTGIYQQFNRNFVIPFQLSVDFIVDLFSSLQFFSMITNIFLVSFVIPCPSGVHAHDAVAILTWPFVLILSKCLCYWATLYQWFITRSEIFFYVEY